ncbi:MAG: nitrilase family protein [Bacteroidales bacterium]|nr:nitrilase family protein [Bacteroidales bacterium]
MKINLIQTDIVWGDPQANCAHLDKLLADAPQADLYVLPEMFTTGFATLPGATVEHEPSAGLAWMQRKAAQLHAAVAGSIALEVPGHGRKDLSVIPAEAPESRTACVNRFYFVRPDGSYVQYDKRHLFGYGGEGERFRAGTERVVIEYLGVRFLLAVCYDLRFPVWLRSRDDYDAILLVASWPDVRRYAWDTLARARAIENACYVAAVNRVGEDPACKYNGGTALIGPYGETLAQAEDGKECVLCGEIDLGHLVSYHRKFPVLQDADDFEIR